MEVKKNVPEEVKNQKVDGKPRVITEKIPEKQLTKIQDALKKKQKYLNQFLQLSLQIVNAQAEQRDLQKRLSDNDQSYKSRVEDAYKKMKLSKNKDYGFRFDGRDSFIGVHNPPKKEEK